jgi:hypothetical protein
MSEKLDTLIKRMFEDPSSERVAFKTLAERADRAKFLDPLRKAGLFAPERNPSPKPSEQKGFFVVPFWPALEFLEKVAQPNAGAGSASQLLQIMKEVTYWKDPSGAATDNYHTWYAFANILASIPVNLLSIEDIKMIGVWLSSTYDRGLTGGVIANRLLPSVLASPVSSKCELARVILSEVTKIQRIKRKIGDSERDEIHAQLDGFHLRELFEKNVDALGNECGQMAIDVLSDRARELWEADRDHPSYWKRPAIEEHDQNKHRDETFNAFAAALRDILLRYAALDAKGGSKALNAMLASGVPLLKRVALHALDRHYGKFGNLFWRHLKKADFLDLEVRHELYWLLRNNFKEFDENQRARLIAYIRGTRTPRRKGVSATEKARLDMRVQRDWLHAMAGQGEEAVDGQYAKLAELVGPSGKHPDLLSYIESRSGPGPSPYEVERLLSEDCADLVLLLNGFREDKGWDKPTLRALIQVMQVAVKQRPDKFVDCLRHFRELRIAYKYALIEGFRQAIGATPMPYQAILDFIGREVRSAQLWEEAKEADAEAAGLANPTVHWFVSSAADFIADVVKKDDLDIGQEFTGKAVDVLSTLLQKVEPERVESESNPLDRGINTDRGRAIEALFGCGLRIARDRVKKGEAREIAWQTIEPVVNREIKKARGGMNSEFIAITASMLPQLLYLNEQWVDNNIEQIFDTTDERFHAAIVGFSYVNLFQKELYKVLRAKGILAVALAREFKESHVREKVLQFIGVAYLEGDEELSDQQGLFRKVVDASVEQDLAELVGFFWMQRGDLGKDRGIANRILAFWEYCHRLLRNREPQFPKLFSKFCVLAEYLPDLNANNAPLLIQAVPYVDEEYNSTFLLKELHRLIPTNPVLGAAIVLEMMKKYRPRYEDADFVKLVEILYQLGQKAVADEVCNLTKDFPKIREIYTQQTP